MFQTAPGVTIPFPEKIQEQFQVYEGQSIRANISFEKLKSLLTEFYQSLPECKCQRKSEPGAHEKVSRKRPRKSEPERSRIVDPVC